jgi:large subunit ribosomal protein L4
LWKGGGVIFAPKSRDYSKKVNKKVRALAMKSVFSAKAQDNELRVLNELLMEAPKTKEMVAVLNNIKAEKALIVLPENNDVIIRSANNIPKVATTTVNELNVYDMLKYDVLVMTKEALEKIEEVYA